MFETKIKRRHGGRGVGFHLKSRVAIRPYASAFGFG